MSCQSQYHTIQHFVDIPLLPLSCAHRFLLLSAPTGHNASQLSSGCTRISLSFALVKSSYGSSTSYSVLISFIALSTQRSSAPASNGNRIAYESYMLIKNKPVIRTWLRICLTCTCESFHILVNIFICKYCFYSRHLHRNISTYFL